MFCRPTFSANLLCPIPARMSRIAALANLQIWLRQPGLSLPPFVSVACVIAAGSLVLCCLGFVVLETCHSFFSVFVQHHVFFCCFLSAFKCCAFRVLRLFISKHAPVFKILRMTRLGMLISVVANFEFSVQYLYRAVLFFKLGWKK